MKKMVAVLLAVLSLRSACAAEEYRRPMDEWDIPRSIRTEADLAKYEGYRRGFMWAGAGLIGASVITSIVADRYHRRASNTPVYGPVIGVPDGMGGVRGVQTFIPGGLEKRDKLYSRSTALKTGSIIGTLAGLMCLSIAFSMRF